MLSLYIIKTFQRHEAIQSVNVGANVSTHIDWLIDWLITVFILFENG